MAYIRNGRQTPTLDYIKVRTLSRALTHRLWFAVGGLVLDPRLKAGASDSPPHAPALRLGLCANLGVQNPPIMNQLPPTGSTLFSVDTVEMKRRAYGFRNDSSFLLRILNLIRTRRRGRLRDATRISTSHRSLSRTQRRLPPALHSEGKSGVPSLLPPQEQWATAQVVDTPLPPR